MLWDYLRYTGNAARGGQRGRAREEDGRSPVFVLSWIENLNTEFRVFPLTRNPKECYGFRSRQKNFLSNRFSVNNMDEQIFIFISAEFKHKKNYMNLFIDNILDNSMREE